MIYLLLLCSIAGYTVLKMLQLYYTYYSAASLREPVTAPSGGIKRYLQERAAADEKRQQLPPQRIKRRLSLTKAFSHFTGIFACVALVFAGLQYWLDHTTNIDLATATVFKIEEAEATITAWLKPIKAATKYELIIIVVLIAAGGAIPMLDKYQVKDKIKKVNKAIKTIAYLLCITSSFTFFGYAYEGAEVKKLKNIERHKLEILAKNKHLYKQVKDCVTEKVVNELLQNRELTYVFDAAENINKNINDALNTDAYKDFTASAPEGLQGHLSIDIVNKLFNEQYRFSYSFDNLEIKFRHRYESSAPGITADFYEAQEQKAYEAFNAKAEAHNVKNQSAATTRQAEKIVEEVQAATHSKFARYYDKYKEPIEKTIKKCYSETGKQWLKEILETAGLDIPFMDEFIDPLIHEPIENYITQKTESILKSAFSNDSKGVQEALATCVPEFTAKFEPSLKENIKMVKLKESLAPALAKATALTPGVNNEIAGIYKQGDAYLQQLCEKSRWERIRISFGSHIDRYELNPFTHEQIEKFRKVIDDWEAHKAKHKLEWYATKLDNIEDVFYDYSALEPDVKACWGFILQQEDDIAAGEYFARTAPPNSVRKQPGNLLKYYYNSTGKGEYFETRYDEATDVSVDFLCPPEP